MEYNKKQFCKANDKKILHKVGKHWVSIGLSTLVAIGGVAAATQIENTADADSVNQTNHSSISINPVDQHSSATLATDSTNHKASQSSSSSINVNRLQQQANNLHTEILSHSLNKLSASQVNSTQGRSQVTNSTSSNTTDASRENNQSSFAASSLTSQSPLNSLAATSGGHNKSSASSAVNNAITVQYFNQNNKLVGAGIVSARASGISVDVINPQDGGVAIPNGYTLNNNQDPNATFNNAKQTMQFGVSGETVHGNINVTIVKKDENGSFSSDTKTVNISGVVGNTVDIQPKDYVNDIPNQTPQDYYYIDSGDHSIFLTVHPADAKHPTAYFIPNNVRYQYDESKKSPQTTGIITVHYRDINTDGKINNINVRGGINTPFNIKTYQDNVPQNYYYVKTAPYEAGMPTPTTFKNQNQDVIIYVHPLLYLRARLQFQNQSDYDNVVSTRILMSKSPNKPIDYQYLENYYTPKGYISVGLGKSNDPILKNGDTDIIYVKHGEDGIINVQYIYNNKVVGSVSDRKPLNESFSISHYLDHAPVGYKSANQIISGQDVTKFLNNPQTVKIGVVPNNSDSNNQATIYITYRNINDPNNVVKTLRDTGKLGATINYSDYEKSPKLPSDYTFDYLDSAADKQFKDGGTENIFIKPIEKQNQATVYIDYRDINNINHIVKTVSDSGTPGATIDYSKYEKSPELPKGYIFVAPGSTDSTFSNDAHESLLVKQTSVPSDHHSSDNTNKDISGTILYKDDKTGSIKNRVTITGHENEQIDYNKYTTNDSPYMPSGYQFDKLGIGTGQFLEPNVNYIILVKADNSSQQQGTINVNYEDASDNDKVIQSFHPRQNAGTPFTIGDYINQIPSDYKFDKLGDGSGVKQFTDQTQNVDILVNKKSKSAQQIDTTLIYQDENTQSDVSTAPLNGPQGMQINYDNYTNDSKIPSGYHFDRLTNTDPKTLQPNASYIVLISKNSSNNQPQINTSVIYRNSQTQSDVTSAPLNGKQGTSVDYTKYTSQIPDGYKLDKLADGDSTTLQKNGQYIVLITPISNQQPATGRVTYRNSQTNSDVTNNTINGYLGMPINYTYYIHQIPQGYAFDKLANGDTSTLQNNGQYVILVTPKSNHPQQVNTKVIYRNSQTDSDVASVPLSGSQGTNVDYNNYTNNSQIPSGYTFDRLANNDDNTLQPNGNYIVLVNPKPDDQQPQVNTSMIYRNSQTGSDVATEPLNGRQGISVDYNYYINEVPSGYTFDRLADGDSNNLQKNGQYVIMVNPVSQPNSNEVDDPLEYQDVATGKQVGSTYTIHGTVGQQINFGQYDNSAYLPKGYHLVSNPDNDTLESGQRYVIRVAANSSNNNNHNGGNHNHNGGNTPTNQYGTIKVMYIDGQNNVISKYSDHQLVGSLYNSSDYINRIPANYKFDGIISGNGVNRFTASPQDILVRVSSTRSNPVPTPNPTPNSSSSVTPSPSPAPSPNSNNSNSASSSNSQPSAPNSNSNNNHSSSSSNNPMPSSSSNSNSSSSSAQPSSHAASSSSNSVPSSVPSSSNSRSGSQSSSDSDSDSDSNSNPNSDSNSDSDPNSDSNGGQSNSGTPTTSQNNNDSNPNASHSANSNGGNNVNAPSGQNSQNTNGQNNLQNGSLPQTGERTNNKALDIFAWLALAAMVSMWGSATDRRRRRRD